MMLKKQKFLFLLALGLCVALSVSAAKDAPIYKFQTGVFYTNWLVAGALPNCPAPADKQSIRKGFFYDFLTKIGGETKAIPKEGDQIPDRAAFTFNKFISLTSDIDLAAKFGLKNQVLAYAFAFVEVDKDTNAFLQVGSDDGIRVWIDDKLVIDSYIERGYTPDEDSAKVFLKKGKHRILVKSENNFGEWKFSLRFVNKKTHNKILSEKISNSLVAKLICSTDIWAQAKISVNTAPTTKDLPIKISGYWLSFDRTATQKFSVAPGAEIPIPSNFIKNPYCSFFAEATGVTDKKPTLSLNIYFSPLDKIYLERVEKIQTLFNFLNSTSSTKRLFDKHRGILNYYLIELAKYKNSELINSNIKAHYLLTKIDAAIKTLTRKKDYLDSLHGTYTAAYISKVDNSCQPFLINIPQKYEKGLPMPLIVFLHDAQKQNSVFFKNANNEIPFFAVEPNARGKSTAYLGLSALDVLETIDFMTNFYSIDQDRIYIIGKGMGGFGVWNICSLMPDLFAAAAPISARSDNIPFDNLINLPLFIAHGESDMITPAGYSTAAANYLEKITCPAIVNILNGVGYQIKFAVQAKKPIKWLLGNRKNSAPNEIIINNSLPSFSQNSWMKILAKSNPRKPAKIIARFVDANQLVISFDNVESAEFLPNDKLIDSESLLGIILNGKYFEVSAPLPDKIFINKVESLYEISNKAPENISSYKPGSWQKFYDGKPFLIVKGTLGDETTVNKINACAESIAKWCFPAREMSAATIPIVKDTEISDEQINNNNLILIGTDKQNKIVKKINDDLIIKIKKSNIELFDKSFPLEKFGMWLCGLNPLNNNKLIWIWASKNIDFYNTKADWINQWNFPCEDPPDFLLLNLQKQTFAAAAHFTKEWKIEKMPMMKNFLTNNHQLISIAAKVILNISGTDFVFIDTRQPFSNFKNFPAYEIANIIFKNQTICICEISGTNLKKIGDKYRKRLFPITKKIFDNQKYHLAVMPSELKKISNIINKPIVKAKYFTAPFKQKFMEKLTK